MLVISPTRQSSGQPTAVLLVVSIRVSSAVVCRSLGTLGSSMDWLTFTVEMTKVLAWPLTALALFGLFFEELRELLKKVRRGKLGPAEFEFEQGVLDLQADLLPATELTGRKENLPDGAAQLGTSARSKVIEAWIGVEVAMVELAKKLPGFNALAGFYGGAYAIDLVQKNQALEAHWIIAYRELQRLRNRAAHDINFSPEQAAVETYLELAGDLKLAVEAATEKAE